MDKVIVVLKHMQYEGTTIEKVFNNYRVARSHIEKVYPKGKLDKDGDWIINEPGEKRWLSFHEERVIGD